MLHDITRLENDEDNPIGGSAGIPRESTHDARKFDHLFDDLENPLYPGCETFSVLTFLINLMPVKILNKITNKAFDMLLKLLIEAHPNAKLPASHYEAKLYLRALGLGYESSHTCKFDCALFWKENATLEECPECKTSRWVDTETKGKKIPHKVLCYFRLKPRLQ